MNVTVNLPKELADYLEAKLSEGVYATSSDMVGAALRLLQHAENTDADEIEYLRTAYRIGLEGGDPKEADFAALKEEGRRRLAALKS